jgi:hypothetical protein
MQYIVLKKLKSKDRFVLDSNVMINKSANNNILKTAALIGGNHK